MKILIDEQLPTKLKYIFSDTDYEVFTVRDMKWLGTKNGHLLELMRINNFNTLLTNDKNLYYQQKISSLKVCIVNVNSKTNRYEDVFELVEKIKNKLNEVENHLNNKPGGYFIV
jgi:predicted nuclease of predicted toxin-antitoxin system